ncbi:LppC family lipoprotein [Psychromonas sp. RZ22]|uniref:penicillin-binding protein activator n=1 Tax=Psychromonas algarum TaxID=2555643 RepID=UPI001067D56E|nr:penicillin-binding protein activator [Psychromonas sp. RZ22]TEW54891.1 LppC family lipoprotein [Psychromonas sp. RZ22]
MNTAILSKRTLHLPFIAVSLLLLLSACSGLGGKAKTPPVLFSQFSENAEYLLKEADLVDEKENSDWQLAAVQALTKEKKFVLADSVIEHLQKKVLTAQQKNNLFLLIADNQYAQNKLVEAMKSLKNVDARLLSMPANIHYLKLKAQLQIRNKQYQEASDTLLKLTPLLTDDVDKQKYNDMLFNQLIMLDPAVLNQFEKKKLSTDTKASQQQSDNKTNKKGASSDAALAEELAKIEAEMNTETDKESKPALSKNEIFVQGWYSLAALYQRDRLRTNRLLRALEIWEETYPTHPVLEFMPTPLRNIPEASPYQPAKVAVLLPLSGRFQKPAQALQYGISHAFYNQVALKQQLKIEEAKLKEHNEQLAIANGSNKGKTGSQGSGDIAINENVDTELAPPSLLFFDTQKMTMQEIADQMYAQNIDFILGPLLKPNLEAFLPLVEDIPVLALNAFPTSELANEDNKQGSSLHYAFPLSPENEAEQAADIIFQNQHKKPLILAPKSDFGRRVAKAFEDRWQVLNQEQQEKSDETIESYPAETHLFSAKSQFAKFTADAMQTDESQQRINQMKAIVSSSLETEVRSRRDVDAIYIVGRRSELILLKPFLAVTISPFAKSIPLYASSRSHDADLTQTQNKELTGLTFSDIAFLMNDKGQINQQIQAIWPKQRFRTLRLFALGYDSYNLIEQLKQLQMIDGYHYQGLVGELTLDKSNSLNSKLDWAQYKEGSLVEVTAPTSSQ